MRVIDRADAAHRDKASPEASRQFNSFFIAYAKVFNKAYQRTGGRFESPFRRKLVANHRRFAHLVAYIHRNPKQYGFVDDFRQWSVSSYHAIRSAEPTRIQRATVLEWFDGRSVYELAHCAPVPEGTVHALVADDWLRSDEIAHIRWLPPLNDWTGWIADIQKIGPVWTADIEKAGPVWTAVI